MREENISLKHGQARQAVLFEEPGVRLRLVYYSPGAEVPDHQHDRCFLTLLLLGSMQETRDAERFEICAPFAAYMPAGMRHANRYAPTGSLCLTVDFDPALGGDLIGETSRLTGRAALTFDGFRHVGLAKAILAGIERADRSAIRALANALFETPRDAIASPPVWLARARQRLDGGEGAASIEDVARQAGVHRVHLCRAFRRHYGLTPKSYSVNAMCARAVTEALAGGASLTQAAFDAGFCDPSHGAREMAKRTGFSPSALARWLAD
ncbi:helix-turn-helix domain-containing protein [Maricaulis sp.]|uniref:helix-turn-helix domain-containing protein n=1 Tax=Maricaulis sp. TaxID=1486257 RepID=UPI003A8DD7A2